MNTRLSVRRGLPAGDAEDFQLEGGWTCRTFDERGSWCVPRQELATTMQVLLQSRRVRVAPTLPQTATLVRELTAFQPKTTAGRKEELDVWRQGRHDDLVLVVAVGAWLRENAMHRLVV